MGHFSLTFIFAEAQKEISIDGEGDMFDQAVFNLISTFAENVDFEEYQIKVSLYKQNTLELRQRISELSDYYKGSVPKIQQLPAFFKTQQENEWFYISYNNFPAQDELIKIGASLEFLNGGKPYQQTMQEINNLFSDVTDKYEIHTFLGNTRKRFYGESDKTKRVCRYCHRSEKDGAMFTQEAHAISDSLGNKVLYSNEECDECNDYLGSHCEQDFGEYLRLQRCYFGVKGREGVPIVRGRNFEMSHPDGQPIKIDYSCLTGNVPDDINNLVLQYEMEYNPQNLYRALVKYFIGLVPQKYVSHFHKTGSWVKGVDKDGLPVSLNQLPTIRQMSISQPVDRPQVIMYIRKDNDKSLPYAVGELHILNYIFVYIIPLADEDDRDFCGEEDFNRFWNFFKHYSSIPKWSSININIDQKVRTLVNINIGGKNHK